MSEDQVSKDRFKVMERKLYNGIMTPSAIAAIIFGSWLLVYGFWGNWMIAKLILVGLTIVYHLWCGHTLKQFAQDQNKHSDKYYRIMNELPVFILIPIVILVVVKPF